MKSKPNQAAFKPTDDERLAALMMSPFVDKALSERKAERQAERHKHAGEIAKINTREIAERNRLDAAITIANEAVKAAQEALKAAQDEALRLSWERHSLVVECGRAREIHQAALYETAPPELTEFISDMRDAFDASLGYKALNHMIGYRRNANGKLLARLRTDAPAAAKWRENVLAALREGEELKLEPDMGKIAMRVAELRSLLTDVRQLEFYEILVDPNFVR